MPRLNENYLNLKESYLFSEIARREKPGERRADHPAWYRRRDKTSWEDGFKRPA